jgi:prophage tail gpP-like protein
MSEKSGSHVDLTERNKWEYNIRQARSRVYSATVHGFRNQTGSLWAINKTVSVNDEFAGINARMLINSVKFSISDSGKETVLSLVNKDSYTLELPTQTSIDQIGLKFAETPEKGIIFVENPDDPEDLFGPGR